MASRPLQAASNAEACWHAVRRFFCNLYQSCEGLFDPLSLVVNGLRAHLFAALCSNGISPFAASKIALKLDIRPVSSEPRPPKRSG